MQKSFQPWWTLYIIPSSWNLPRVFMETPFKWTAPDVANVVGTCCGACWNTVFSTRNTPSPPGGAGSSLVIETNSLQDIMALVALGKRWLECGVGWCNPQLSLMLFFAFDVSKNLFFKWNERNQWGILLATQWLYSETLAWHIQASENGEKPNRLEEHQSALREHRWNSPESDQVGHRISPYA